jgi:hypothetical protein
MACSGADSLLLRSPSGGHAGVKEVEGGDQGVAGALGGGGRRLWEEGLMDWCVLSSQKPPLYRRWEGAPCPLPKAALGGGQEGEGSGGD